MKEKNIFKMDLNEIDNTMDNLLSKTTPKKLSKELLGGRREEDKKRIKQRIEDIREYLEYGLPYSEYLDLENSFDHILSDYKRVLKKNEQLILKVNSLTQENNEQQELIDKMKSFLLKENKMCKFLESE